MPACVVDSNVLLVASELAEQATSRCVVACINALLEIQSAGHLLLDELGLILSEYMDSLGYAGKPGVGRAFAKWAFDHQSDATWVRQIPISRCTEAGWRLFNEFPADDNLQRFHNDDQKFVAVAVASGDHPPILNAVDSDWWNFRAQLEHNGVRIDFLCPDRFAE